jgi:polar amino acid transport system substrate-binding protein
MEVDLTFGDGQQLAFWLQSASAGGCCAFAGGPYLDSRYFGEGYAVHAINAALQAIAAKGVFGDLYLRYFPIGFF